MENKRIKVRLSSVEKIEELLQEVYDQACRQINEIQNEINRLIPNQHNTQELVKEYNYLGLGTQYDNVRTGLDYQEQQSMNQEPEYEEEESHGMSM